MKVVLLSALIMSFNCFSSTAIVQKIVCAKAPHKVEINYAEFGEGNNLKRIPFWTLFKKGKAIKPYINQFSTVQAAYDGSFLNSYVFGFESANAVIAVAIPGLKELKPSIYTNAKSDLFVDAGSEYMDGSTLNCRVIIK
jgi:hypothetical protein